MSCRVRWSSSPLASHLYVAAAAGLNWPLVNQAIGGRFRNPLDKLGSLGVPPRQLMRFAVPAAGDTDSPADVAVQMSQALAKNAFPTSWRESVTSELDCIWHIGQRCFPDVNAELTLRMRPLREHWEARGPGLLAAIARRWPFCAIPTEALVQLAYPVCGGGGDAHLGFNRVTIEAVLVNPLAGLPEVVRLGWFFTQLGLVHDGHGPTDEARRLVSALALLMTLSAAEEVELLEFNQQTTDQALAAWRAIETMPQSCAEFAAWWRCRSEGVFSARRGWSAAFRDLTSQLKAEKKDDEPAEPVKQALICCSTPRTPSNGIRGAKRHSSDPSRNRSRSFCRSVILPVTGAT